jgi:ankyrin repeat protein
MDRFGYEPIDLEECSFRLLQLYQGTDGPIECYLFDAMLDSIVEYDALSYTWGCSEQPYEITINGSTMPVTINLSQALWDLRHPDKDRILWVDAICINQKDLKERGHQVQHMASIYKRAEQVIVWLGPSTPDTKLLFCHMRRMETLANEHAYYGWKISDKRWQDLWSAAAPMFDDNSTTWLRQQCHGLKSILSRPWFTRVWIIQEIANARSARIMCGTATVSAPVFAIMPSMLGITVDPHCQAIIDIMPGPLRRKSWWAENRDLRTLLLKFRSSKASDPRDAIYALLGVSSDTSESQSLLANYELSVEKAVDNTTAFLLSWNNDDAAFSLQWTLLEFMQNLESLGSKVLIWALKNGHEELVRHLIDLNHTSSALLDIEEEVLPLYAAVKGYRIITKPSYARGGFDINARDDEDRTLLFGAAMEGHAMLVGMLLHTGRAEVDVEDKYGLSPLAVAVQNGHTTVVKLLLQALGTKVTERVFKTPLFLAAEYGNDAAMELLLELDIKDLNMKNKFGQTLLSLAAQNGHEKVVKLLLGTGEVDVLVRDNDGETPLSLAIRNRHYEIVRRFKCRAELPRMMCIKTKRHLCC